ncbi:MAG: 30S ribosomal protein S16 [Alphaproteobacteria bacterium PRO2]|nr:30S ribosomal protein S16 [Alphaproteobacteria bacterium PRO2]
MAVVIRMSRGGRRNLPFYRIVVADSRFPRDGRYIERVGTYNPLLKTGDENRVQLVKDRIEHWLKQGAKPSERVAMFLGQAGMIDMPKQPNRPSKSAPGEKAKARVEEKAAKKAAAEEAAKAAKEAPAPAPAEAPAETPAEAANEAAPPAEEAKAAG